MPADPVSLKFLDSPRPALAPGVIASALREAWGIEGRIEILGGDRDQNLAVHAADGRSYLVKIGQTAEDPDVIDMQLAALRHVAARDPSLPVPRVVATRDGAWRHAVPAGDNGQHLFRVFSHLPGRPIGDGTRDPALMRRTGGLIARLDLALRGFFHAAAGHDLLWDLRQAASVRPWTGAIREADWRARVEGVLDGFIEHTLPKLGGLRSQVIHGDLTGDNILTGSDPARVTGLIDFGDALHAPLCQEAAVAMADVPWGLDQPWTAACHLAAGFDEVIAFEEEELVLLWDLARARVAVTAAVVAARDAHRAEGAGSMAGAARAARRQLEAMDAVGAGPALDELRRTLRAPAAIAPGIAARDLGSRRQRSLPTLELFYPGRPLHLVRGRGMWVHDASGNRYLDFYNNVPHVGHAHPHVANAVARQTATLNTNTRYLYDSILDYAERLAGLLPADLGVFLFVNSGSEANDIAWRMARAATGHAGALVTAHAYHGGTTAIASLSPGDGAAGQRPAHVRGVLAPGPDAGGGTAARCLADVDRGVAELQASGHGVAAFMVDTTFASDGILNPPAGYLPGAFERVRAAGGLCIADEVQAGFGRSGDWWGFEHQGVVPDIVTLGKPMANGYPASAVVTTPAIMAAFGRDASYFSTFGGNPVACMAGLAVLDVIEREDLLARALELGGYLQNSLKELACRHSLIVEVRGRGLFQGVELSQGGDAGRPAASEASEVARALRDRGVLVATEGPHGNVLKIRPPMVCEREHVDVLVDELDRVLGDRTECPGP